jgi:protoporphyrinogen/coproporphyrinogen III oxidase
MLFMLSRDSEAHFSPNGSRRVIIVGGGITGLSAAHALNKAGAHVTLLEAGSQLGGKLCTLTLETPLGKAVIDGGAESFVTRKPEAYQLALELGLGSELHDSGAETKGVYLWTEDQMTEIPTSPGAFFRSSLLTALEKFRMLREPFTPGRSDFEDESLESFLTRRLGTGAAKIFGPVMAGIYGGDPGVQSVNASFPILRDLERESGSLMRSMLSKLVRGMLRRKPKRDKSKKIPRAISFDGGAKVIVDALASSLEPFVDVRLNAHVHSLTQIGNTWRVHLENGEILESDAVILACPANVSAQLLTCVAPDAANALREIRHTGIGTLALVYPRAVLEHHQHLRGLMIPRHQNRAIDAVLFSGFKMPARVAPDLTAIRVFFGANNPDLVTLPENQLLEVVQRELKTMLGLNAAPLTHHAFRWPQGFPVLELGHLDRVTLSERLMPHSVFLAGASYRGLGVPDCVRQGQEAATKALGLPVLA